MYLLFLVTCVAGKFISTSLTLTPDMPWKYVSKFAVDIGKGEWEMRAKLLKPVDETNTDTIDYTVNVYLDDKWEDALSADSCSAKEQATKRSRSIRIPYNGEWSRYVSGTVSQRVKAHFWFFAISDCSKTISEKHRIRVELRLTNVGDSEFSLEEKGMVYLFPLIMLVYLVALSGNLVRLINKFKKTEDIEPSLLMLNLAIGFQFLGIVSEVLHLWVYAYNGSGIPAFDFFHQALEVLSGLIVTTMFILMATGWTLKFKDFPEPDIYIPIGLLIVLLNLLVVGLGRITEDSYYKFSDYEGIPGAILVTIRLAMWGWFFYLVRDLQSVVGGKIQNFVLHFSVLGSVYFFSQPFLVVLSWVFETYWRNTVVVIGTTLIQISVFVFLTHLFSEKSTYYKISTMSESVLPGKIK